MAKTAHQMYMANSPYYRGILASEGRHIRPAVVKTILNDHSVPLQDYLGDPMIAQGSLPAKTDAADLLLFLGY